MTAHVRERLEQQQRLAQQIRDLQAEERELRAGILDELFGPDNIGSCKTMVDNVLVTGDYGLSYKFNQEALDRALDEGHLTEAALNVVRVKYDLDKKAYDQLDEETLNEINEFLTIAPTLPTLKVKTDVADED